MQFKNRASLCTLALAAISAVALAGPLTPPAGPVTSTNKTLQEVEPRVAINLTNTPGDADSLFKITQRGSYYLTGNITGVLNKHGIEIVASGVTLDLMGFDLSGVPAIGAFDGVSVTVSNLSNITIRNGSVRNWGDEGVDLGTVGASNSAVIDVRVSGNTGSGISTGTSSTITGCSARDNTGIGISSGATGTITGCAASSNTGGGILTSHGCTITGCTASFNDASGILTGSGSTITGCTAYANIASGISAGAGSTITGCTAYSNNASGISTGISCTISNCTALFNALDGIRVSFSCVVLANTCTQNGLGGDGAGIHATGSNNRIEGNNCTDADRGIDVDVGGNIIIRNTCSGNTINWVIAANNVVGPILDRRAPASAAISGNSAPDSTGSTHPNANFTY